MTVIGDKIKMAVNAKNNDVKLFVWKGKKEVIGSERVQDEIKLIDATEEQLNTFYNHCKSMLYSTNKENPGRYVLLDIIKEQRLKCNAELYVRWLEQGDKISGRKEYLRFMYLQDLKAFLNMNKELFPKESWPEIKITEATNGIPAEFTELSIKTVLDACADTLGRFDKKHISMNFITGLGLWFEPQDIKELSVKDESTGKMKNRLDVIRERHDIKNTTKLKINSKGLNYTEFRAMINLKSGKYSSLTTNQLTTLRNKVLFRLEDQVSFHASQWENRMKQIKMVADYKGITLS